MKSEEKLDQEIASGIFAEVKLTMQRIERSHKAAPGPLKSDAYSQMVRSGYWDAKKIISTYLLIQKKECKASANIRNMIVTIFQAASTNFWAKKVYKAKKKDEGNKTSTQPNKNS